MYKALRCYSRTLGGWLGKMTMVLLACLVTTLLICGGGAPTILPQAGLVRNIFTPFAHFPSSQTMEAGHAAKSGIASSETNNTSPGWLRHLCPHYQEKEGYIKLTWQTPTEDTIFFTQTSCRPFLLPREVREFKDNYY